MKLQLTSVEADTAFVRVEGPITPGGVWMAHDPLEQLIDPRGCSRAIVLNLEGAEWIDSSGIAWLLRWHRRAEHAGGVFGVCALPARVSQVLRVSHLDRVLTIWPDEATARATLDARVPPRGD
jgi:anti-sigma B factor antagonist